MGRFPSPPFIKSLFFCIQCGPVRCHAKGSIILLSVFLTHPNPPLKKSTHVNALHGTGSTMSFMSSPRKFIQSIISQTHNATNTMADTSSKQTINTNNASPINNADVKQTGTQGAPPPPPIPQPNATVNANTSIESIEKIISITDRSTVNFGQCTMNSFHEPFSAISDQIKDTSKHVAQYQLGLTNFINESNSLLKASCEFQQSLLKNLPDTPPLPGAVTRSALSVNIGGQVIDIDPLNTKLYSKPSLQFIIDPYYSDQLIRDHQHHPFLDCNPLNVIAALGINNTNAAQATSANNTAQTDSEGHPKNKKARTTDTTTPSVKDMDPPPLGDIYGLMQIYKNALHYKYDPKKKKDTEVTLPFDRPRSILHLIPKEVTDYLSEKHSELWEAEYFTVFDNHQSPQDSFNSLVCGHEGRHIVYIQDEGGCQYVLYHNGTFPTRPTGATKEFWSNGENDFIHFFVDAGKGKVKHHHFKCDDPSRAVSTQKGSLLRFGLFNFVVFIPPGTNQLSLYYSFKEDQNKAPYSETTSPRIGEPPNKAIMIKRLLILATLDRACTRSLPQRFTPPPKEINVYHDHFQWITKPPAKQKSVSFFNDLGQKISKSLRKQHQSFHRLHMHDKLACAFATHFCQQSTGHLVVITFKDGRNIMTTVDTLCAYPRSLICKWFTTDLSPENGIVLTKPGASSHTTKELLAKFTEQTSKLCLPQATLDIIDQHQQEFFSSDSMKSHTMDNRIDKLVELGVKKELYQIAQVMTNISESQRIETDYFTLDLSNARILRQSFEYVLEQMRLIRLYNDGLTPELSYMTFPKGTNFAINVNATLNVLGIVREQF